MKELTAKEKRVLNFILKEHIEEVKGLIKIETGIREKEELQNEIDTVSSALSKLELED